MNYDKTPKPFKMSRAQLAQFFIDQIDKLDYIQKTPILSEKSWLIFYIYSMFDKILLQDKECNNLKKQSSEET